MTEKLKPTETAEKIAEADRLMDAMDGEQLPPEEAVKRALEVLTILAACREAYDRPLHEAEIVELEKISEDEKEEREREWSWLKRKGYNISEWLYFRFLRSGFSINRAEKRVELVMMAVFAVMVLILLVAMVLGFVEDAHHS